MDCDCSSERANKGKLYSDSKIQELRQYSRRIFHLTRRKQQAESAIDLTLQRCNIRLSNYVSDIGCKSMRKVVNALICGETDSGSISSVGSQAYS